MRLLSRASHLDTDEYQAAIDAGLDQAYASAARHDVQLADLRAVLFSDLHRGSRDGADDFQRCEPAYAAALGWYLERGYELWLLGDIEELWENDVDEVLPAYAGMLELERAFQSGPGLRRLYGNHDSDWAPGGRRLKALRAHLPGIVVDEAVRVRVADGSETLGELFLVHGHQGTDVSDRNAAFSRLVLRWVWRYVQRAQGLLSTTPARDFALRHKHDSAMFAWARTRASSGPRDGRPVLIAGHTHHPVFPGPHPPPAGAEDAVALEEQLRRAREDAASHSELAGLRAELERVRALLRLEPYHAPPVDPPCYFNTGCGCFPDRDVTGLEMADGRIRLVRWLDDQGDARPKLLADASLRSVLERVRAA